MYIDNPQWDALLVKSRQIGPAFERLISFLESKSKGCLIPIFYLMSFKMEITTLLLYEICHNETAKLGGHLPTQFKINTAGA